MTDTDIYSCSNNYHEFDEDPPCTDCGMLCSDHEANLLNRIKALEVTLRHIGEELSRARSDYCPKCKSHVAYCLVDCPLKRIQSMITELKL